MVYENPDLDGLDKESIKNELVKQYTHHTQIFDEEEQDPSFVKVRRVLYCITCAKLISYSASL